MENLEFEYSAAGVSQSLIIYSLARPEDMGIVGSNVKVSLMSEVMDSPTPQITERVSMSGTNIFREQLLDFGGGAMRMVGGRGFRAGSDRRHGIPVERRYEVIGGRAVIFESLSYSIIARELKQSRSAGVRVANNAGSKNTPRLAETATPLLQEGRSIRREEARSISQKSQSLLTSLRPTPARQASAPTFSLTLPPPPKAGSSASKPIKRTAALEKRDGFVLDWDYVDGGSSWVFASCQTYVVQGDLHLAAAEFHPTAIVKVDLDGSLVVDGPFSWSSSSDCGGSAATITSVNDDTRGDWIDWSNSDPQAGEYGPALAVPAADLTSAQAHIDVYYADPGIIENVAPPATVNIAATDSQATKGSADYGAFTLIRSTWDYSEPLTVSFSVSGTAVAGTDYQSLGTSATIPVGEDSVVITTMC